MNGKQALTLALLGSLLVTLNTPQATTVKPSSPRQTGAHTAAKNRNRRKKRKNAKKKQ